MENPTLIAEPMTWQAFKHTLLQNPDRFLQFQYAEGAFVHPSFHIIEIKQVPIVSVDCSGQMNSWTEVIVQLREPRATEADQSMTVGKALSIVNLVEPANRVAHRLPKKSRLHRFRSLRCGLRSWFGLLLRPSHYALVIKTCSRPLIANNVTRLATHA